MKKIPLRRCVATGEQLPKKEMIRVVKNNQNEIFIDLTSKANGRGAYIKRSLEAIDLAQKKKVLNHALKTEVDSKIFDELRVLLNE